MTRAPIIRRVVWGVIGRIISQNCAQNHAESYDVGMAKLLPLIFFAALLSLGGLLFMIFNVDPASAAWYVFVFFVALVFSFVTFMLTVVLYLVRVRIYSRKFLDNNWYATTSFKMAVFIALFAAGATTLAILQLATLFNLAILVVAISLLGVWVYLGKRK